MSKRIITVLLAAVLIISVLSGCGSSSGTAATSGSDEKCDVNVGLIMGPPSMGLGWFMNEVSQGNTYNNFSLTVDGMDYSALAASLNDGTYDIINAPSNVAAILYNNEDLQVGVKVISINNTGLLHVVTTDPSIKTIEDLAGKNVYSIGEGGTPEYALKHCLELCDLTDSVNLSFKSTPFEVLNILQQEENAVAVLPQPFVEVAKTMVDDLLIPVDLTEVWNEKEPSGTETITTVTIVRDDFLEAHEQAVIEFLQMCKKSTDYTNKHVDEAAEWTDTYGTFMNPEIATDAIPECSICTITGDEMKEKLSGFIEIMYNMNPEAVGGAIPGDDFYYIPEKGAIK